MVLAAPTDVPDVFSLGERYAVGALVALGALAVLGWASDALADFPLVISVALAAFVSVALLTWPWAYDPVESAREMVALAANLLLFVSTFALARRLPIATSVWLLILVAQSAATQAVAFAFHVGEGLATRPQGYEPRAWSGYPEIGALTSISVAVLLAACQYARGWAWVAALGLLSVTLVQTVFLFSRVGYIATIACMAAALGVGMATRQWRRLVFAGGAGVALAGALWVASPTFAHLAPGPFGSEGAPDGYLATAQLQVAPLSMRTAIWQRTLRMIGDHPLGLGVGLGNFREVYEPNYNPTPNNDGRRGVHAHNAWLEKAGEIGIAGALAFAGVWLGVLWLSVAAVRRHPSLAAAAVLYVLVALLVQNMTDDYFWVSSGARGRLQSLHWMVFGLAAALGVGGNIGARR